MTGAANRYPRDAKRAADGLASHAANHDFPRCMARHPLRFAVERLFTIMGEALNIARRVGPDTAAAIPDPARSVGLRNLIAHRLWSVEHDGIWDVAVHDLLPFQATPGRILESAGQ